MRVLKFCYFIPAGLALLLSGSICALETPAESQSTSLSDVPANPPTWAPVDYRHELRFGAGFGYRAAGDFNVAVAPGYAAWIARPLQVVVDTGIQFGGRGSYALSALGGLRLSGLADLPTSHFFIEAAAGVAMIDRSGPEAPFGVPMVRASLGKRFEMPDKQAWSPYVYVRESFYSSGGRFDWGVALLNFSVFL